VNTYQFTKAEIQNYLINRSFLVNKAKSIDEILETFRCIQVDPIVVIAKSHDLSLWNRVEGYTNTTLDTELYKNRTLFEYWMQLYSIIPLKYRPYFSARMQVGESWQDEFYSEHKTEVDTARQFIVENGLTSAKELTHIPRTKTVFSWKGNDSGKATLEYLWDRGEITISHRNSNHKIYDLTERLIQEEQLKSMDIDTSIDFLVKSNFHYLGMIRKGFIVRSGRSIAPLLKSKFLELCANGTISMLNIEGVKTSYYVLTEHLEIIKKLGLNNTHHQLNILPPLDPLIIDRQMLKDVFGFEYTWEVYTPEHKRKFSYYGMPILYKGNFVGQVELTKIPAKRKIKITKLQSSIKDKEFKSYLKHTIQEMGEFVFGLKVKNVT
jgi:uncharacterized protein YcaQ